jgi:hypothetical protein
LWRDEKQKPVEGRGLPYPTLCCKKLTNTGQLAHAWAMGKNSRVWVTRIYIISNLYTAMLCK